MQIYIRLFALFNVVNGLAMLIAPEVWYELTPGASDTGPFNVHFVRDIGIAYLAVGIGLWLGVTNHRLQALSGALVAMVFVGGHAVFHFIEMFAHHVDSTSAVRDLILIVLPTAIAAVWMVAAIRRIRASRPLQPPHGSEAES